MADWPGMGWPECARTGELTGLERGSGGHGANPLSGDGLGRARRVESRPAEAGKTHPENSHKLLITIDL